MNIELARTFLEAVSCGSLAAAADRLNVTHSTVTMRIKTLEQILRCRVLIRNRSGVTMTAQGMRFHRMAEALVRTWEMTRREMSLRSGFDGMLSVGADPSLWEDFAFDWSVKTRRQRPDIALRCESNSNEVLLERVSQGWLDFCLVFEPRPQSELTAEKLFDDPLVVVSLEDRPAKDYWDPDYIEIDWNPNFQNQSQAHFPEVIETPHISASNMQVGLRFIMEFGGSTVVPQRVLDSGRLPAPMYRVPEQPVYAQSIYLVYSKETIEERLQNVSLQDVRTSLTKCFDGEEQIWEEPRKKRRRTAVVH